MFQMELKQLLYGFCHCASARNRINHFINERTLLNLHIEAEIPVKDQRKSSNRQTVSLDAPDWARGGFKMCLIAAFVRLITVYSCNNSMKLSNPVIHAFPIKADSISP